MVVKIEVEPERFSRLLKQALIYDGSPIFDNGTTLSFSEKGVIVKDNYQAHIAVYHMYTPKYFLKYECKETENIRIDPELIKTIGWFKDEQITIETTEYDFIIRGSGHEYKEALRLATEPELGFGVKFTEQGVLHEKFEPAVQVLVDPSALDMPSSKEKYRLKYDKRLSLTAYTGFGEYTKVVPVKREEKTGSLDISIDEKQFRHIISNLDSDTWLSANEDMLILSQKSKDHLLTFITAVMLE